MNDVIVKLSREAEEMYEYDEEMYEYDDRPKSALAHASEKAVESYFGLFHLLLCLATETPQIVQDANRRLARFLGGNTSKDASPNLGHLLVAALISDQGLTEDLTMAVIKEAILRNVVWMLDSKGAGMAELSYLEPSAISDYRLQRTFEASTTSYRLLMFLALFYRTARAPGEPIAKTCDGLFDRHGAPPKGTAEQLATAIRHIRTITNFPDFLKAMGLKTMPTKSEFSTFLKRTIEDSARMGYSSWPISQGQALALRKQREPYVEQAKGVVLAIRLPAQRHINFFPPKRPAGRR
ncbi:hypothetical protein MMC28_005251 [Mycoblastus sanguinarius]|nr:hypothetical protein [Mycoblastus sanguinarius]